MAQPSILTEGLRIVKVKADLDKVDHTKAIHGWLDKWKGSVISCSRSGGVWEEKYEVLLPAHAIDDLPKELVNSIACPVFF